MEKDRPEMDLITAGMISTGYEVIACDNYRERAPNINTEKHEEATPSLPDQTKPIISHGGAALLTLLGFN